MKLLFHLAHPAHYHLFKNVTASLSSKCQVFISYNTKDVLKYLINNNNGNNFTVFEINTNRKSSGLLSLSSEFLQKEIGLYKLAKKLKPGLIIGTPVIVAHVGKILGIKSLIVNEDDFDIIYNSVRIGYPFADHILAPSCCRTIQFAGKTIQYNGYHELAYLHPKYFSPQFEKIKVISVSLDEKFFIIRLASLTAHHDIGKKGIDKTIVQKLIDKLLPYGNVFITAERELEPVFEPYRIKIDPLHIHHAMAFAHLYIGDSQTMAAEAAVLGTPSIRFNDFVGKLGYLEELEHQYGLTYGIKTSEPEKLFQKIDELLSMPNLKEEWQRRRQKMLADKIDVTAFFSWFIESYPDSVRIMKENPDYQYRFR